MRNLYSDKELKKFKKNWPDKRVSNNLIERIYTSRLLGQNPNLVLHGGGNTSFKDTIKDFDNIVHKVIFIKGSGSDLASIEKKDFPAVKLDPLLKIIKKTSLSDDKMVSYLRKNLIDINSPNPSVETLVHAAINKKFIDHTHSNAILEITDRKNGTLLCKKIFGDEIALIPYVMPGFVLAKAVDKIYNKNPNVKGLILYKHGIFTFGNTAKESYDEMIRLVTKAEKYLKSEKQKKLPSIKSKKTPFGPDTIAPIIRGLLSKSTNYVLNFRSNNQLMDIIDSKDARKFLAKGVVTPDHVIRIKPKILVININNCKSVSSLEKIISKKINDYSLGYKKYFNKYNIPKKQNKMLDPVPKIIAIQSMGLFSAGKSLSDSKVNGDVAEMAIKSIGNIERRSTFQSITMKDIFDVEYWSLEQAKLGKSSLPLMGKITIITGGVGTIGLAIARKFKKMGSEVILVDVNRNQFKNSEIIKEFNVQYCDVTKRSEFERVLKKVCVDYGGVDFIISNAGNAFQGEIANLKDTDLKNSFDTNFFSHQIVASESVKIMKMQNIGGCLLFNISKQAVNPGKNFGAYGTPKAALLALCKQYALEYGGIGIRSNGVNADRVASGLLTKKMIKARAKSRNLSVEKYLSNNLLKKSVLAEDVAEAFYTLSVSKKTTAAILTVDGGNIEASLR